MASVTAGSAPHEADTIRAVLPQLAPFLGILALGLFQQAANFLVGGIFSSVAVFTLFIVVLLAAPQGLFGTSTARRV